MGSSIQTEGAVTSLYAAREYIVSIKFRNNNLQDMPASGYLRFQNFEVEVGDRVGTT